MCNNNLSVALWVYMKRVSVIAIVFVALLSGCERTVEVEKPLYPTEGAINARYSIDDDVTVVFAKGNLQYQASTHTWRFAQNQYDVAGFDNELADTTYGGWTDLFGWGTSGYRELMPYTISDSSENYAYGCWDITDSEYDWGKHNAISNGGNKEGQWRTMTYDEWQHLLKYRTDAWKKRAFATIEHVGRNGSPMYGLVLLPDKWEQPEGCEFHYDSEEGYASNVYSPDQWNRMQGAGAVFLPAGGERNGVHVGMVGEYGCYWTSNGYTLSSAYEFYFLSSEYGFYTTDRADGHSVRLVMER